MVSVVKSNLLPSNYLSREKGLGFGFKKKLSEFINSTPSQLLDQQGKMENGSFNKLPMKSVS
jgi:hypothetical protein